MMTVLLIDDNDDEFVMLSKALYRLDRLLNCVHADSAESAIEMLRNFSPHYIFIDLNMNEPTGLEFIVQTRRLENLQKTPLVVYSANISEAQWEKAKTSGANGYLQKTGRLVTLVDNLVSFFVEFNRSLFNG
jgi:CheY-like chemotaxis protein